MADSQNFGCFGGNFMGSPCASQTPMQHCGAIGFAHKLYVGHWLLYVITHLTHRFCIMIGQEHSNWRWLFLLFLYQLSKKTLPQQPHSESTIHTATKFLSCSNETRNTELPFGICCRFLCSNCAESVDNIDCCISVIHGAFIFTQLRLGKIECSMDHLGRLVTIPLEAVHI